MGNLAWLHTSSTNMGIAAVAGAVAGWATGAMTWQAAVSAAVTGLISILLPQKASVVMPPKV